MLADGRGRGKSSYEKPYTEAAEVSLSQHYHGQKVPIDRGETSAAVRASGVTGVTHPCTTGPLTPAPSPRSPLHQRARCQRVVVQCPDLPSR